MKQQIDAIYISSDRKIDIVKAGELNITNLSRVEDVFSLLSDPKFNADAIIIEVDANYPNTNLYELIPALKVVIGCTVQRSGAGKPTKRNTKICAAMGPDVDKNFARDFINMKEIEGFVVSLGVSTFEELSSCLTEILNGSRVLPKKLRDRLYPKRTKVEDHIIKLTPRQSQILHLVSERGASNKIIARTLKISESTVKLHMSAILKKFGVRNRTQLAIFSRNR